MVATARGRSRPAVGTRTRTIAFLVVAVVGVAALGVLLGRLVVGPLASFLDRDVDGPTRSFSIDHTNPTFVRLANDATRFGSVAATGVAAVAVALLHWWRTRNARRAMLLVTAFVGAGAVTVLVKYGIHRSPMSGPTPRFTPGTFPSGHTLFAVAVYGSVAFLVARANGWRVVRAVVVAMLVAVIVAIGLARIYLLDHYASDVLGSLVLGVALICAQWVILGRA
jgi:undecaprenyl-diphosphatase